MSIDERLIRPDGSIRHCAALVRSGEGWRVEVAAFCGHGPARQVLDCDNMPKWPRCKCEGPAGEDGPGVCIGCAPLAHFKSWLRGLRRWHWSVLDRAEEAPWGVDLGCKHGVWHKIRGNRLMEYLGSEPCGASDWDYCHVYEPRLRKGISSNLIRWSLELDKNAQ